MKFSLNFSFGHHEVFTKISDGVVVMRKVVVSLICGAFVGWFLCWVAIRRNQEYRPIEEAKICYINLEASWGSLDPQLREYLKVRLYSAAANYVNEGWLEGWEIDFGPVDDAVLSPVYAVKNASPTEEVYEAAMQRHPRSAIRNQQL